MISRAQSLLFLLESNIKLGWIIVIPTENSIPNVKIESVYFDKGNKQLTLYTDFPGSLKNNATFLSEFQRRLSMKGIRGKLTFLKEKPAEIDKRPTVSGTVTYKVDDQLAQGLDDWYK